MPIEKAMSPAIAGRAIGIEKTEGVCGGSARIARTRIPVWPLVAARDLGVSEAQLLIDDPMLGPEDLVNAWSDARAHCEEILAEIRGNEDARPLAQFGSNENPCHRLS